MRSVRSSSIVPGRSGDVIYLVLDDFGPIGQAYREADPGEPDESAMSGICWLGNTRIRSASSHSA
jgi:hypothetical protein